MRHETHQDKPPPFDVWKNSADYLIRKHNAKRQRDSGYLSIPTREMFKAFELGQSPDSFVENSISYQTTPRTLSETLADSGYITKPALGMGCRHILDGDNCTVFTGNAAEVWEWLKDESEPYSVPQTSGDYEDEGRTT